MGRERRNLSAIELEQERRERERERRERERRRSRRSKRRGWMDSAQYREYV
jgi:hypothetical protein